MSNTVKVEILQNRHPVLIGMLAGVLAVAASGGSDKLLDRFVSKKQKRRDRWVREASAHELAGPYFASKLLGHRLTKDGKKRARAAFSVLYGIGWGLIHSGLRRKYPKLCRWGGLPFAVPFFFACDGMIAPMLGINPTLRRIPWQPSAKEMGNHIVWTAAAEFVHRLAARAR